jgi:hypothetical protein
VEDLPLSEILNYFKDDNKRRSIFSQTTKTGDEILEATIHMGPKYSASAKLPAIEQLLPVTGTKTFNGIANAILGPHKVPTHLLIVGFDYDSNRATFFRSAPAGGASWGEGEPATVTLAEAVHASTNAPVNFFDGPALLPLDIDRYWDGGITGCNNPSLVAVVEAITLGQPPQKIHVLSLGTASVALPLAAPGAASSPLHGHETVVSPRAKARLRRL